MTDKDFRAWHSSLRNAGYREDFEAALYDLYAACDTAQREQLRHEVRTGAIQPPQAWRNPTDYVRSDLTREQRLRQMLVQRSIAGLTADLRNDLCGLAYCYHNLALLGLDADAILEDVASLSDPEFAAFVRGFIHRRAKDRSTEAFGLMVVKTPAGLVADWSV